MASGGRGNQCTVRGVTAYPDTDCPLQSVAQTSGVQHQPPLWEHSLQSLQHNPRRSPYD